MNTQRKPVTKVRGVRCKHTFLIIGGELMRNAAFSGMRSGVAIKTAKPVEPHTDWYGNDEREIIAPCPYPDSMHR